MYMALGCKDKAIRELDFEPGTQFLYKNDNSQGHEEFSK